MQHRGIDNEDLPTDRDLPVVYSAFIYRDQACGELEHGARGFILPIPRAGVVIVQGQHMGYLSPHLIYKV